MYTTHTHVGKTSKKMFSGFRMITCKRIIPWVKYVDRIEEVIDRREVCWKPFITKKTWGKTICQCENVFYIYRKFYVSGHKTWSSFVSIVLAHTEHVPIPTVDNTKLWPKCLGYSPFLTKLPVFVIRHSYVR